MLHTKNQSQFIALAFPFLQLDFDTALTLFRYIYDIRSKAARARLSKVYTHTHKNGEKW